jgi:hypothetical protein
MNWVIILIGVVAIVVVSKLIHFKHFKHKIGAIAIVLFLLFLSLTFMNVIKDNAINLSSPSGVFSAAKIYFSWMVQIFDNVKVLTGNAIRMDWSGNLTK